MGPNSTVPKERINNQNIMIHRKGPILSCRRIDRFTANKVDLVNAVYFLTSSD